MKMRVLFAMWIIVLLHAVALLSGPKDIYQYVILIMDTFFMICGTANIIKKNGGKGNDDEN